MPILDFFSLLSYLNLMKIWNPVAYSVSIYGSLYCFTSFLYMQGVSFFLFVRLLFQKKSDDLEFIGSIKDVYQDLRLHQVLAPEV